MNNIPMTFTVNGRFLTQKITGVQRYAREILASMDGILREQGARDLRAKVVVPRDVAIDSPFSSMCLQHAPPGSGIAWEQFVLPLYRRGPLLNLCNLAPLSITNQVVCIHDLNTLMAPESYSHTFRLAYGIMQPNLARRAAKLVTVSHYSARILAREGYRAESQIQVIPNGHEHAKRWNACASTLKLSERTRPYVFVLGSLARHKNVDILYSIAPALNALGVDLLVAGGSATIFSDVGARTEAPNVIRLGFVSDDDLAALFKHALCFAFPSLTEGFGLPVLEALAVGCPVVASDIPALREVAGDCALYARPQSAADWFQQVANLREDKGLCADLTERGVTRAEQFSWAEGARAYLNLLEDISY